MIRRGDLTPPVQRLLAALASGAGAKHGGMWVVENCDERFQHSTVEAAYARYLVNIVVESRHRRRHTLMLTQIGHAVAHGLAARRAGGVTEQAARLIQEIVDVDKAA